jgi:NTE family protein
VLDRLVEDGFRADRISAVSSGALLGVAFTQGWARDGAAGARQAMAALWHRIAAAHGAEAGLMPWLWSGWAQAMAERGANTMLRMFGPATPGSGPAATLRRLIEELLEPELLRSAAAPRLTVGATDALSGEPVLFDNAAITAEALLASCCLPFLFPPVRLGGRVLWDGAYSGNPPLRPLLQPRLPGTLVLIRAQARVHRQVPDAGHVLLARIQEIAFNAALQAELAALPEAVRLVDLGDDAVFNGLEATSRLHSTPAQIQSLFEAGRQVGGRQNQAA